MRKFLIPAALLSAAGLSAPASAQYGYNDRGYGYDFRYDRDAERRIERDLNRVHDRIDRAAERGELSRREAFRLQRQFDGIARRYSRYRYNGLSGREFFDIERRIRALEARLEYERRDGYRSRGYRR